MHCTTTISRVKPWKCTHNLICDLRVVEPAKDTYAGRCYSTAGPFPKFCCCASFPFGQVCLQNSCVLYWNGHFLVMRRPSSLDATGTDSNAQAIVLRRYCAVCCPMQFSFRPTFDQPMFKCGFAQFVFLPCRDQSMSDIGYASGDSLPKTEDQSMLPCRL